MAKRRDKRNKTEARDSNPKESIAGPALERAKWAGWESKISRLQQKNLDRIIQGWANHVPSCQEAGERPLAGIGEISTVAELFKKVQRDGELLEPLEGVRSAILHEAIYLAHKAIHVELGCLELLERGRHTWAVVDAYQSSLFSIASIFAFLGITIDRDGNDFVLLDAWAVPAHGKRKPGINLGPEEYGQFIRFNELPHYQKWAILQRLFRTLTSESPLIDLVARALGHYEEKEFALFRNKVNYNSASWIYDDLLEGEFEEKIRPVANVQEMVEAISDKEAAGSVYLMILLNEIICMCLGRISSAATGAALSKDFAFMERRRDRISSVVSFDLRDLYVSGEA